MFYRYSETNLNLKFYVAFIDLEKAFDYVLKTTLTNPFQTWYTWKITQMHSNMYKSTKARVRCGGDFTDYLDCTKGVKHGDICSPIPLFAFY